jgi:hypothetical protein
MPDPAPEPSSDIATEQLRKMENDDRISIDSASARGCRGEMSVTETLYVQSFTQERRSATAQPRRSCNLSGDCWHQRVVVLSLYCCPCVSILVDCWEQTVAWQQRCIIAHNRPVSNSLPHSQSRAMQAPYATFTSIKDPQLSFPLLEISFDVALQQQIADALGCETSDVQLLLPDGRPLPSTAELFGQHGHSVLPLLQFRLADALPQQLPASTKLRGSELHYVARFYHRQLVEMHTLRECPPQDGVKIEASELQVSLYRCSARLLTLESVAQDVHRYFLETIAHTKDSGVRFMVSTPLRCSSKVDAGAQAGGRRCQRRAKRVKPAIHR